MNPRFVVMRIPRYHQVSDDGSLESIADELAGAHSHDYAVIRVADVHRLLERIECDETEHAAAAQQADVDFDMCRQQRDIAEERATDLAAALVDMSIRVQRAEAELRVIRLLGGRAR